MTDKTITVSQLRFHAAEMVADGEMPSFETVLNAVNEARKEFNEKRRALWRTELDFELAAKAKKR